MKSNWVSYKNGNYTVMLNLSDGTKIRKNNLDFLQADTVESLDYKITDSCNMGCSMCHENSTPNGKHGNIMHHKFIDNLHPYTELAIGGGNPLEHPDLIPFLKKCRKLKLIPSMTVNQVHFEENLEMLKNLISENLIYGLGISLVKPSFEFLKEVVHFKNAVIHVINGLVTEEQLAQMKNLNLKVLILGYKEFRRGARLFEKEPERITAGKESMKALLPVILKEKWFNAVSFDNLALKQLDVRSLMTQEQWDMFFMGDDGIDGEQTSATMYVDGVREQFAKNSCAVERYALMDDIKDMYRFLCEVR